MRTKMNLRAPSRKQVVAGTLALAAPGAAVALVSGAAQALGATGGPALQTSVSRHSVRYEHYVSVHGSAPTADAGQPVELQFEPAGTSAWRSLTQATVQSNGRFYFRVRLVRSGRLRAVSQQSQRPNAVGLSTASSPTPSNPQAVGVSADLRVKRSARVLRTGRRLTVRGRLLPGQGSRSVRLLARQGGRWQTVARTRTGRRGGFDLRYAVRFTGTRSLRVRFAGDRSNRGTWTGAGSVTGLVPRVASWYNDGGSTACGFHAHFGVANRTLPCGTRVTFAYGGRSVVATVDDRGPYVGGRDYDLNQNTAGALGMYGVATLLASR
jgi:rare lipoprotein A